MCNNLGKTPFAPLETTQKQTDIQSLNITSNLSCSQKADIINSLLDEILDPQKEANVDILLIALLNRLGANNSPSKNTPHFLLNQELLKIIK